MSRAKFDMVFEEGNRFLDVRHDDYEGFRIMASSETGNVAQKKTSTTWRWEHNGKLFRVQVQVTEL